MTVRIRGADSRHLLNEPSEIWWYELVAQRAVYEEIFCHGFIAYLLKWEQVEKSAVFTGKQKRQKKQKKQKGFFFVLFALSCLFCFLM
jgi:hypothetical protein